jgi:hypothetical protein
MGPIGLDPEDGAGSEEGARSGLEKEPPIERAGSFFGGYCASNLGLTLAPKTPNVPNIKRGI